ncbi:peptidoglycan DD-metalloendopeptidase family protein [Staphylococcus shinii]|uniref:peptidoglycan DD-metalloendopeptidase family protein n=1 Tax=Staphylococcus shinii TaxID=2912228 RepID=UPI003F83C699
MLKDAKKKKKKKDDEEHGAMDAIGTKFGVSGGGKSWQEKLAGGLGTAAGKLEGGKKKVVAGAKAGAKAVGDKIGEVLDYVGKPGKLLDAVLGKFGVDFGNVKGEIPKDMMWDGMWKGLKGGVKTLFDGWLTEADGAGDGGYVDLSKGINFGFAPTAAAAAAQGYPFPRPHMGLDINYKYGEKLYSTLGGKGTGKSGYNGGFGNSMWLKSGNLEAIYGHMSKLAWNGTRSVKPGSYLGRVGSTGDSTGPHLHYEMRRNGKPFDPTKWLKSNNGSGKGGGKYGKQIKQALGMAGLPQTNKYIKAWQEQARTESTFNPRAKNPSGASGLVQVKPGTFNQYKLPGHGNIWNPLDNLIAGMRYAKARYGTKGMLNQIGHGLPYKTGGIINSSGMYQLAEDNHSEVVIPLDPARSSDAMKLMNYASSKIKDKKNKRPNQVSSRYSNGNSKDNSNEVLNALVQMVAGQQEEISLLKQLVASSRNIEEKPMGFNEKDISQAQGARGRMAKFNKGI